MKAFSTSAARISVIRSEGFYPSLRVAENIAASLGRLFEFSPAALVECTARLVGTTVNPLDSRLTSAEDRVIDDFLQWYSAERSDHAFTNAKAFVAVDLNNGRCLVVSERAFQPESVSIANFVRSVRKTS